LALLSICSFFFSIGDSFYYRMAMSDANRGPMISPSYCAEILPAREPPGGPGQLPQVFCRKRNTRIRENKIEPPAHQDGIYLLWAVEFASMMCLSQSVKALISHPGGVPLVPVDQDMLWKYFLDLLQMLRRIIKDISECLNDGQIDFMVLAHGLEPIPEFIR